MIGKRPGTRASVNRKEKQKEKHMVKASTKTKATKKNNSEKLEWERLFGPNIDHYIAMNRCQILSRIFHHAGPQDVRDDDIWESAAPFIKGDEFQNLMDELI
jgi:hypothetical protein